MFDELGGEVVAAGVGALLLGHVKDENRGGFLAGHSLLHGGNLSFHGADDFLGLVLHLEDAAQVVEVLIHHVYVGPHGVPFDGGQGHDAVLGEGVVLRVVLLRKGAGAAIDEVGLQVQDGLQRDVGLRGLGNFLIRRVPLGIDVGVGIGGGDDLVPQPQSHELVAGIGVGGDDALRDVRECDHCPVFGGQSERERAGVCGGRGVLRGVRGGGGGRRSAAGGQVPCQKKSQGER